MSQQQQQNQNQQNQNQNQMNQSYNNQENQNNQNQNSGFKPSGFRKKFFNKNFKKEEGYREKKKEEKHDKKEITKMKMDKINALLMEKSLFSKKSTPDAEVSYVKERIVAHDNYSDAMIVFAAISEYKMLVEGVGPKAKAFQSMWSLPEHVFMRRMMLQKYLAIQPELTDLNQIPSVRSVSNKFDVVQKELESMPASKEFFKVFLNYLPTKDSNGNIQMLLPYTWRDDRGHAVGHQPQNVYNINNNLGMTDVCCFTRNEGSYNWVPQVVPNNAWVRRYDPMSVMQFMYNQTRPNNQLHGAPPAPGQASFQPNQFSVSGFNNLFGTTTIYQGVNYQKTTNSPDMFESQQLKNGCLFNNNIMEWVHVVESFPEIKSKVMTMSFKIEEFTMIIRSSPFRPVLWGQDEHGNDDLTFTIQGGAMHHLMSPFLFSNINNARNWGGFLIHIGSITQGCGDINFFTSFSVGSHNWKDLERTDLIKSLELIFKKEVDTIISSHLPLDF